MSRRAAFWLAIFAAWTVLVIVFAVSSSLTYALNYQPPRWRYTLAMSATEWYVWAALTPLVAWLARPRPAGFRWWRIAVLAVIGLPIAFIKVTITHVLRRAADGGAAYFQISDLVVQYLIFWAIVGCTHAWEYYRTTQERELRAAQLETLLAQTRLQMLGMQLQPHFLFNTLNTIAELVHHEPEAAERMIGDLSHLLRETLQAGLVERVPLQQELSLLDRYVEIQRARFGDRLAVTVSIDEAARDALVPTLLLQPLVENAIRHGIGERAGAGRIEVTARCAEGRLVVEVRDDGRGFDAAGVIDGIGLSNCRSRLHAMFGDAAHVRCHNAPQGGAIVRIEMPA